MAVEANQSPWPNVPDFPNVQQQIPFPVDNVAQSKRSREFFNHFYPAPESQMNTNVGSSHFSSFFDESINLFPQFQQQQHQFQIDSIISKHTKKMRMDLQEKQKQHTKSMITSIGEKAIRKLKEKDEQIMKMGNLNWALQERVKCLLFENQLWKDLAQTNEAQAHSLRADLEQALAHYKVASDDVESCCGGSNGGDVGGGGWTCKRCGEKESSVLVLPCRHLCLCDVCGSGAYHVEFCPVCSCGMSGTLHVNMSP